VRIYRTTVGVFATVFVLIGFAVLVRTALLGGGAVGFLVGCLFIALGTARLWLLRRG
jgi:hypothetical protein